MWRTDKTTWVCGVLFMLASQGFEGFISPSFPGNAAGAGHGCEAVLFPDGKSMEFCGVDPRCIRLFLRVCLQPGAGAGAAIAGWVISEVQLWFGCSFGSYSCRAVGLQQGPAAPLPVQRKFDPAPCGTCSLWSSGNALPTFSWSNGRAGVQFLHLRGAGRALLPLGMGQVLVWGSP